jgi:hypothetical protein
MAKYPISSTQLVNNQPPDQHHPAIAHPRQRPHLPFPTIFRAFRSLCTEIASPPSHHRNRAHSSHLFGAFGHHDGHLSPPSRRSNHAHTLANRHGNVLAIRTFPWPLPQWCELREVRIRRRVSWVGLDATINSKCGGRQRRTTQLCLDLFVVAFGVLFDAGFQLNHNICGHKKQQTMQRRNATKMDDISPRNTNKVAGNEPNDIRWD